ncbi:MAG: ferric reductase-like transmembrane domain-containing protein [bacterium]
MRWSIALLWFVAGVPVGAALLNVSAADFHSCAAILNLLGRLTGIGGLSLFLVAAILSNRVPGFDLYFGGLTKLWQTHHVLAATSFFLLLAHPLLLAFAASNVSLEAAAQTLLKPELDWGLWLGWIGLLLLFLVFAPSFSFFGNPEYKRWRQLHRLSVISLLAALGHTYFSSRTISDPLNSILWMGLAGLALCAVAYRFFFSRHIASYLYRIKQIARPANNIVELSLAPADEHLKYQPGQFVYLTPYDSALSNGRGEEHPYTLTSAPGEPQLRVAIKAMGDATRAIQDISTDSLVRIEGPYGDFFSRSKPEVPELWIAGGIGIAPFLGRARHMFGRSESVAGNANVHLVHCVQDEARAHYSDELRALAARTHEFEFTQHFFYQQGPLASEFLQQCCPDFASREIYICGPDELMMLAQTIAKNAGVPSTRLHTEAFTLL